MKLDLLFGKRSVRKWGSKPARPPHQLITHCTRPRNGSPLRRLAAGYLLLSVATGESSRRACPASSPTRWLTQTWLDLFVAPCNPQNLWTSMWTTAFDTENSLAWRPTLQPA